MEKIKNNLLYYILLILPLIDFESSILAYNGQYLGISAIIKSLLIIVFFLVVLKNNNDRKVNLFLLLYFIVLCCYLLFNNNVGWYVSSLLKIFCLPIGLLFFKDYKNRKLNVNFLIKIYYIYLLLFIGSNCLGIKSYYGIEVSGFLLCLMPIVLNYLYEHHNWLIKIMGFILIFWSIVLNSSLFVGFLISIGYLVWKNRNNKFKLILGVIVLGLLVLTSNNNLEVLAINWFNSVKEIFNSIDSLEWFNYLFGTGKLVLNSNVDVINILFSLGIVGVVVYGYVVYYGIRRIRLKGIYAFCFYYSLLMSFLVGNVLNSGLVVIWLVMIVMACKNASNKKRILMVSNMYPSKRAKHYGSFVKNMVDSLSMDYDVTLSVMKKHSFVLSKLVCYGIFYVKTFIKALMGSYDYIWVHFVSHSTWPVIFGYKFTKGTKLILNAHGNDLIADYNFEKENMIKSKKYLDYASLVVVSSKYYQEEVAKIYNYPIEKIKICHAGGVDLDVFKHLDKCECKKILGLDEKFSYIGLVSRIEKDKGYDVLLEALYLLKEDKELDNVRLVVIGTGSEENNFNYLVNKYHLENLIIKRDFVYQSDLVNYYNAFDVLVFPTKRKSESLGLVGLEAMACKTFVIGCDLYGPSEYLKDKENCLAYHNVRMAKSLARRIRMYYNMSDIERENIIMNGYETARLFSKENVLKEILEIIGE